MRLRYDFVYRDRLKSNDKLSEILSKQNTCKDLNIIVFFLCTAKIDYMFATRNGIKSKSK